MTTNTFPLSRGQSELEEALAAQYAKSKLAWERPGMSCVDHDGDLYYRYTETGWIHEYPSTETHQTQAVLFRNGFASKYAFGHSLERAVRNGPNVQDPYTVFALMAELPANVELVYIPDLTGGPRISAMRMAWTVSLFQEDRTSRILGQGKTKAEAILRALLSFVIPV